MTNFATALLAAAVLMQPALSVAGDAPAASGANSSSFVPHAHTQQHIYGSPIQPAIVGRAKTAHHKSTPRKPASHAVHRGAVNRP